MRVGVCNASPLIILAKAGYLDILPKVFERIAVPRAVQDEIMAGPTDDPAKKVLNSLPWLEVVELKPDLTPLACWHLGRGETEVIEYARTNGATALLDDSSARRAATALGVPVLGTLGLLAKVMQGSPIEFFGEAVQRLRDAGIRLDDSVVASISKSLGEK